MSLYLLLLLCIWLSDCLKCCGELQDLVICSLNERKFNYIMWMSCTRYGLDHNKLASHFALLTFHLVKQLITVYVNIFNIIFLKYLPVITFGIPYIILYHRIPVLNILSVDKLPRLIWLRATRPILFVDAFL